MITSHISQFCLKNQGYHRDSCPEQTEYYIYLHSTVHIFPCYLFHADPPLAHLFYY